MHLFCTCLNWIIWSPLLLHGNKPLLPLEMHVVSLFISTFKVAIFRQEKVLLERSLSSVHKCLLFLLEAKFKLTGRFFILKEYQSATRRSPFADNKKVGWWKFSKKTILKNRQKLWWMVLWARIRNLLEEMLKPVFCVWMQNCPLQTETWVLQNHKKSSSMPDVTGNKIFMQHT